MSGRPKLLALLVVLGCTSAPGVMPGLSGTSEETTAGSLTTLETASDGVVSATAATTISEATQTSDGTAASDDTSVATTDTTTGDDTSGVTTNGSEGTTFADTETTSGAADDTGSTTSEEPVNPHVTQCEGESLPEEPPPVCSVNGGGNVTLTFVNNCAATDVRIMRVTTSCGEVEAQTISAGNEWSVSAAPNIRWRIRDLEDDDLLHDIREPPGMAATIAVLP